MNAPDSTPTPLESLTKEERDARTNAFLASEEFVPFVLKCLAAAAREAAEENASFGLKEEDFKEGGRFFKRGS